MFSSPIDHRYQREHEQENTLYESKHLSSPLNLPNSLFGTSSPATSPFGQPGRNQFGTGSRKPLSCFSTNVTASSPSPRSTFSSSFSSSSSCSIFTTHMPLSPPTTPKHMRFEQNPFDAAAAAVTIAAASARNTQSSKMMQQIEQKRHSQARPMAKTSEQRLRERREGFLNRVREKQDSQRWDRRSDQILHDDYITQKRAWEEELARSAPTWDIDSADQVPQDEQVLDNQQSGPVAECQTDMNMIISQPDPTNSHSEEAEIEALLDSEARELDALVALHEASHTNQDNEDLYVEDLDDEELWDDVQNVLAADPIVSSPRYGSDEDGFDDWMKGLAEDSNVDAMDIS